MKKLLLAFGIASVLGVASLLVFKTATKVETKKEIETVLTEDLKVGDGAEAVAGKIVGVHYTTYLHNGMKKVDSSLDRGVEFRFKVGAGQVIPGWDQGVLGMKVGGKRKVTVPAKLAYGFRGAGRVVPPNSVLVYETELLSVTDEVAEEVTKPTKTAEAPKAKSTKKK